MSAKGLHIFAPREDSGRGSSGGWSRLQKNSGKSGVVGSAHVESLSHQAILAAQGSLGVRSGISGVLLDVPLFRDG